MRVRELAPDIFLADPSNQLVFTHIWHIGLDYLLSAFSDQYNENPINIMRRPRRCTRLQHGWSSPFFFSLDNATSTSLFMYPNLNKWLADNTANVEVLIR